jgi:hypothetical protein
MATRHKFIAAIATTTLCGMAVAHAIDGEATNDCAAAASSRTAQIDFHPPSYTARPLRLCQRADANVCRSAAPLPAGVIGRTDAPTRPSPRLALNVCYRASE